MNLVEVVVRLLRDQPWLWLVLIAWIVGVIGNIAKKQRDGRSSRRADRRERGDEDAEESRPEPRAAKSEAEIAREMRRILGVEEVPAPPPARKPRRSVVEPERPPTPVRPTTGNRHLPMHGDSHVGEAIGRRAAVGSGRVGEHAAGKELGNLGGRSPVRQRARDLGNRYALVDLKRIIVLNEILGPPLALRGERRD